MQLQPAGDKRERPQDAVHLDVFDERAFVQQTTGVAQTGSGETSSLRSAQLKCASSDRSLDLNLPRGKSSNWATPLLGVSHSSGDSTQFELLRT